MTFPFIRVRLTQLKREVILLGPLYSLFYLGLFTLAGLLLHHQMNRLPNAYYGLVLISLVILSIQINRTDKRFVATTVSSPALIFFNEYLFFSIPVFIIILLSIHWYLFFPLIVLCYVISLINYQPRKRTGRIPFTRYIPSDNFEWIAGFRKHGWYILLVYVMALAFLPAKFVSLLLLWLILGILSSFYQECEPLSILQAKELNSKSFIRDKIRNHLKVYILFSLPIILGYSVLNMETAWVAWLLFLLAIINLCFFILSKYSNYEPNIRIKSNGILIGLALISMLIPFFLPLPMLMSIRAYNKSKKNLQPYLDAYH